MSDCKTPGELNGQELDGIVGGGSRKIGQQATSVSAVTLAEHTSAPADSDEPPRKTIIGGFKSMSGMD